MAENARKFSKYFDGLEQAVKQRYVKKLNLVSKTMDDPYTFSAALITPHSVPAIEYPDIYNYLIETHSIYTKEDMKAYKSLDAYKYLLAGWVGEVSVNCIANSGGIVVVRAKVRHSQSVRASPLLPWAAAKKDGAVLCSHCTCMAGLGEVCSHIAATLFAVDAYNRLSKDDACTSQLCAWLPPSMQNVEYASIFYCSYYKTKEEFGITSRPSHEH